MEQCEIIPYNINQAGMNDNEMFLGEQICMENINGQSYYYEKLLEVKNDIKADMKAEFDKLNIKIDNNGNVITELRIKQTAMEKDIEALQLKNNGNERYSYLLISLVIAAITSGVFKLIFK